jgi:hypothetical protein
VTLLFNNILSESGKKATITETILQLEGVKPDIPTRFWLNLEIDYQFTRILITRRAKVG